MTYTLHEIVQAYGPGTYCEKLPSLGAVDCHLHRIDIRHATSGWAFAGLLLVLTTIALLMWALFFRAALTE